MSERRYYWDAYQTQFTAQVVERVQANGRCALVLDQTYFYPTSGGQPHDTGTLVNTAAAGETAVVDVTVRESDGAILHWLASAIDPETRNVNGRIDWPRRFDHMQQHSGQHILSQALLRTAQVATISFHLSADSVTIDLDTPQLSPEQLAAAETLANEIIWENRPITARQVTLAEAARLNLRKIPEAAQGEGLRLVEIADFDLTACGGTHVAQTGAVGLIKIVKQERMRGQARLVFCCGGRALADYRQKQETLQEMGTLLTTHFVEFPKAVRDLQAELQMANRLAKQQMEQLLALEAEQLWAQGEFYGRYTLVTHIFPDKDAAQLRQLANHLTRRSGTVALLGLAGEKSFLIFSRAANAPGQMNELLQMALTQLGGKGGGTAVTAQGGGAPAELTQLQTLLDQVKAAFARQLAISN